MSDSNSSGGGIGLCGATFLVFLVLKLMNKIDWSWWWVAAPLWIPAAVVMAVAILVGIVAGIAKVVGR